MQLAVRMWTKTGMLYPVKFSVIYNVREKESSIRAFVKNDKFITTDFMMITPFIAINGPIFIDDIVIIDGIEDVFRIVKFDEDDGIYYAVNASNDDDKIKMTNKLSYETAGNIYEDYDLIGRDPIVSSIISEIDQKKMKEIELPVKEEKPKEKTENLKKDEVKNGTNSVDKNKQKEINEKNNQQKNDSDKNKQSESLKNNTGEKVDNNKHVDRNTKNNPINNKKSEQPKEGNEQKQLSNGDAGSIEKSQFHNKKDSVVNDDKNKTDGSVSNDKEKVVEKESIKKDDEKTIVEENDKQVEQIVEKHKELKKEDKSAVKNMGSKKISAELYFVSDCIGTHGSYVFTVSSQGINEMYMGDEDNTNLKKIALQGLIDALATFDGEFSVRLYTNSQYAVYPFLKGWINKWASSNWRKNENSDKIQNYELWAQLLELSNKLNVKWEFVQRPTEQMKKCIEILNKNN